jgi:hypothetical protein
MVNLPTAKVLTLIDMQPTERESIIRIPQLPYVSKGNGSDSIGQLLIIYDTAHQMTCRNLFPNKVTCVRSKAEHAAIDGPTQNVGACTNKVIRACRTSAQNRFPHETVDSTEEVTRLHLVARCSDPPAKAQASLVSTIMLPACYVQITESALGLDTIRRTKLDHDT